MQSLQSNEVDRSGFHFVKLEADVFSEANRPNDQQASMGPIQHLAEYLFGVSPSRNTEVTKGQRDEQRKRVQEIDIEAQERMATKEDKEMMSPATDWPTGSQWRAKAHSMRGHHRRTSFVEETHCSLWVNRYSKRARQQA